MFTPSKWHLQVPRDYASNLDFRRWLNKKTIDNVHRQNAVKKMCSEDIIFFFNAYAWQYNPNVPGKEDGPFVTWDFQDEAIFRILWCVENRKDLVIEKSREMGASWLCLMIMDAICRWRRRKKFLLISRNADAVDRPEDPDCLMWKLDFINEHLPDWMTKGKVKRRKMGITYLETQSNTTGQATTAAAGVGGRATGAFIDEFAKIKEGREVLEATADTTGSRIFNSTHYGLDTAFYELCQRPDMQKLVLHWSQHPAKKKGLYQVDSTGKVDIIDVHHEFPHDYQFIRDGTPSGGPFPGVRSPWYDDECKRRQDARAVAMHLDIDAKGSTYQFYDALKIADLKGKCQDPWWQGELLYDRDLGQPMEMAIAESDNTRSLIKLWLNLDKEGRPPKAKYTAGADIASGTGATPSCFAITDADTGAKVLEYRDAFIDPETFASLCVSLCRLFQDEEGEPAYLTWEMQGPGVKFGTKVMELGFRKMYYRTNEHSLNKETSEVPGWFPSPNNKRLLHEDYRSALYTRQFFNPSVTALDELLAFVHKNGSVEHSMFDVSDDPSAATVNHGDQVIADALSWKGAKGKTLEKRKEEPEIKVGSLAWRRELRKNRQQQLEWVNS